MIWVILAAWSAVQGAGLHIRSLKQGTKSAENLPAFEATDQHHSACLHGKRIAFIGPSTSKLDYLALTFFAEYGRWPDQDSIWFGQPGHLSGSGPNPLYGPLLEYGMEIQGRQPPVPKGTCKTGSSDKFLWYSNEILNGHEVCDCHKVGGWQGPFDVNNQTENRVYNNGKTLIAYFQWFGDVVAPRGTFSFWPLQQQPPMPPQQQCPAGQFKGSWDWSMPLQQFISTAVAPFHPTHLVVDAAFWPIDPYNTPFWDSVAQAGIAAVLSTQGKVLWRTAPKRSDYSADEHSAKVDMTGFLNKGWQLYDANNIVNADYRAHERSWQGPRPDNEVFYDKNHLSPKAECFLMKTFLDRHVCPAH